MSKNNNMKSLKVLPSNLQKYIENIIEQEGYLAYDVDTEEVITNGRSYLGKPYTISIKGKTKQGEKTTEVFVKSIIVLGDFGDMLNLPLAFAAEALVYNDLSKIFNELQEEAGIPIEDRYKIIKSYDVSNSEAIFLENVVVKGYKPCHKAKLMDLYLAEMALKEVAKFHAISFVIKENRPDFFKNVLQKLRHPYIYGTAWEEGVVNIARHTLKYLDGIAKYKMEIFIPKIASKIEDIMVNPTSTICLNHGDFRLPNLLMKYDGEKLKDLYVVDYQFVHLGCPFNDFMFFIITGTDQEFRRKHMKHLKEFYYKSLAEYLKRFNLDAEDLYPKEEFEKDYLARLEYGLCIACCFLQLFLAADDNVPELTDQSTDIISQMEFRLVEEGPKRLKEIVDDYIEWGLI